MPTKQQIALLLTLFASASLSVAQVYESRDAEGNPVFSDTPSEGSQKIKLPEANVAESIEVPERPPEAEPVVSKLPDTELEQPPEVQRGINVRDDNVDRHSVGDGPGNRPGINPPVARPTPHVRPARRGR